jgi:hypothetical protein
VRGLGPNPARCTRDERRASRELLRHGGVLRRLT